jgi:hypothetical protein
MRQEVRYAVGTLNADENSSAARAIDRVIGATVSAGSLAKGATEDKE